MSIQDIADAIVAFIETHRAWAAPMVLVLAFGESLAFISLILPFWGMLVGIGAMIGVDGAEFFLIWVAASVGAALGDWLSYWLGYYFHDRIAGMWPLSRHPDLLPRGHAFFDKYGAWAIVFGRFSGPVSRVRADRRRRHANEPAHVSDRQLEFGVPVGVRAARFR